MPTADGGAAGESLGAPALPLLLLLLLSLTPSRARPRLCPSPLPPPPGPPQQLPPRRWGRGSDLDPRGPDSLPLPPRIRSPTAGPSPPSDLGGGRQRTSHPDTMARGLPGLPRGREGVWGPSARLCCSPCLHRPGSRPLPAEALSPGWLRGGGALPQNAPEGRRGFGAGLRSGAGEPSRLSREGFVHPAEKGCRPSGGAGWALRRSGPCGRSEKLLPFP